LKSIVSEAVRADVVAVTLKLEKLNAVVAEALAVW